MERFMPKDADRVSWGKLVKKWIKDQQKLPGTLDDLVQQMKDDGMSPPTIPSYLKGLVFVQYDKHILMIRLPPKELVEASENKKSGSTGGAGYPLPTFYDDFYVNKTRRTNLTPTELLDLHAARIGEYAINSCD